MNFKRNTVIICLFFAWIQPILAGEFKQENEHNSMKFERGKPNISDQIFDNIIVSGTIELDYSYADDKDMSDNAVNGSTSDLDMGMAELGLEAVLHDHVTAGLILKGEALDSDPDVFWDEAFITIQKPDFPVYFVGGKITQPFGAFEGGFVNDPITQDLYEINKTGAAIGIIPGPPGLDILFSVYKGSVLMQRVSDTGYGFERDHSPGYPAGENGFSYILNMSISPGDGVLFSVSFDSEPGDGERNTTLGGSVHWAAAKLMLDFEYIGALNREKHYTDDMVYKESAWFAAIGFQIVDPLIVAVRYEYFDDGRSGSQAGHMDHRYSLGAVYTLFKQDNLEINLLGEFRRTQFEDEPGTIADNELKEFFVRLALIF